MTEQGVHPASSSPQTREQAVDSICMAWQELAACGAAGRYIGRAPDGQHLYQLSDPVSGVLLGSGRGMTLIEAMSAATHEQTEQEKFYPKNKTPPENEENPCSPGGG